MTINSAEIAVSFKASLSAGSNVFGSQFWNGEMSLIQSFVDGVAANQFDRLYIAERTVLTAANDDIDLNGVLTDIFGVTISAVELAGIVLLNKPKSSSTPNTTNLTIGGSSNGVPGYTTAGATIKPGGFYALMNPDATGIAAITPSTGDILRVTNSAGASNTYQIAALMRSA